MLLVHQLPENKINVEAGETKTYGLCVKQKGAF